ncbi:hypothetical protein ANCCEY_04992 [Ancylostoma ceylanicum]|uniref:Uncharacterized protein n=1 Tax=Ancylostoma ceylanicum TaxID=53326 RepID=A0A0D6M0R3_9BILA|nr:hypothetical protein ANCCEY_04992 [Ancylostoma ceylanicum]
MYCTLCKQLGGEASLPVVYQLSKDMIFAAGRVAIHYVETTNPKDNFTFKCHRSAEVVNGYQEIFGVLASGVP